MAELDDLLKQFQAEGHDVFDAIKRARRPMADLIRSWPVFSQAFIDNIDGLTASVARIYGIGESEQDGVKAVLAAMLIDASNAALKKFPKKRVEEAQRRARQ